MAALVTIAMFGCSKPPSIAAQDAADANDTGGALAAKSDNERALLREVGSLPTDKPRQIGEAAVVAGAPYTAASGRTCRALHLTEKGSTKSEGRLVCNNGKVWFFVPDVFGGELSAPTSSEN